MMNIDFSVDMRRIRLWGIRMGVDLCRPEQLTEPYTWGQSYLLQMAKLLVKFHGFLDIKPSDNRMLFALTCDPWQSGQVPTLTPRGKVVELPINASSFFSPDRQDQWEEVFHSPLWYSVGNDVPGSNTVRDLLNLLQCLLPGMFVIVEVQDGWSTQRGIPPYAWVRENRQVLVGCIGERRYEGLREAASDVRRAVIDSRDVSTNHRV